MNEASVDHMHHHQSVVLLAIAPLYGFTGENDHIRDRVPSHHIRHPSGAAMTQIFSNFFSKSKISGALHYIAYWLLMSIYFIPKYMRILLQTSFNFQFAS